MQIVHSLRTRGDLKFDEIGEVIPCLEMAHDYGYTDLDAEQPGCLRAFKTHFAKHQCPWASRAKYIYVARDPEQACLSFDTFLPTRSGLRCGQRTLA
jgi:Sulfotransferase domain